MPPRKGRALPKRSPRGSREGRRELLARTRELSALIAIGETATQSLDTEKILRETLDKSLELLRFDAGYVRVLDRESGCLGMPIARGLSSPEFLASVVPINSPRRNVAKIIFETREPYVCSDIRRNPIFNNRYMEKAGLISAVWVPVMSKTRVLGLLVVGSKNLHEFSAGEIKLLKAFGAVLGAALENAELYGAVNQGKAYIENLVENAGDAIISTDTGHRILTWNRAAEVIFGYSKEEALGRSLAMLLPWERPAELEEIRHKVEHAGVVRNLELRRKRKDGALIDVSVAVSPIRDGAGRITGFLHSAKDITDKIRYEKRLKELDKMKSDFISNVSHELRTPLTAIKGSVDNMLDGITGPLNDKQTRYLERIKSNADRLARLINNLLDLSRIESGKIELKPEVLPLVALSKEVAESLRPIAVEKLISLEVIAGDSTVTAWADRDKVTQVLMNLVGNALKFTPPEGRVSVVVDRDGEGWVKVSVADTGPGISPEEAGRIFDRFYQSAKAGKQKSLGSGLGLAISKALVEMHGGRIWVDGSAGEGSIFSFTLPSRRPFQLAGSGG